MRNQYTHTTPSKNIQYCNFHNRFSHNTQLTQLTQNVFVSDKITLLPNNMDFQYDYDYESNHS